MTHRMCMAQIPRVSKSCWMCVRFWPRIQGPPTHTFVLWCRGVILPTPSYHQPSLLTAGKTIPPTWLLAQLSPRSIAPPPQHGQRSAHSFPPFTQCPAHCCRGSGRWWCSRPSSPHSNNLLPAHPGPAGAANNLAASRQCQQRVANAAVAGVGNVIYINEVDADSMCCSRNGDNIKAINGVNHVMLHATRMISQAIRRAQPPAAAAIVAPLPNAAAQPLPPGEDSDVIASLYARLASARAANRTDAVDRYERMIDHLERKEEEELEARLNTPA